ncbi:hypothetical protein OC846_005456 [Tilletia horrida]|uniref:30S ribosomal protein S17 n=1 Tax=Tilletia horrida TaxID=155126 RepID=A0AAN6JPH5_9BASI|nr:hypothetical protein OC846_005456 [Tilletia horrida]KAK0566304.1 hypothetical protein OC861_003305 [Tilletia horrida]
MPPMTLQGAIIRAGKMNKTVTMAVAKNVYLPKLQKTVTKHTKYLIHDEKNQLLVGDNVVAQACPPLSARKRFTFLELVGGTEAGAARRLKSQQLLGAEERERVRIEGIVKAERQAVAAQTSSRQASSTAARAKRREEHLARKAERKKNAAAAAAAASSSSTASSSSPTQ